MLGAKCRVLGLKLRVEVRRKPLPSTLATSAPDVPRVGPPVPAVQRTYNILVEGAGETESAKLRREATAALEAGGRVLRFWIPPCPPAEAAARRSCVVEASLWLIDTRKEFTLEWRVGRPPSPPANKHQLPSKRGGVLLPPILQAATDRTPADRLLNAGPSGQSPDRCLRVTRAESDRPRQPHSRARTRRHAACREYREHYGEWSVPNAPIPNPGLSDRAPK